ncbi:MAG: ATP-binding protein [Planctomycetes bacterium]|nr:ATP-binding protein [Planctomycetota bacterium]
MEQQANNPYSSGEPISEMARFHGREEEIEEVMYRLISPQPQSVSIVGLPGIGKSSLMNVLTSAEVAEKFFPPDDEYVCLPMQFSDGDTLEDFFPRLSGLLSERYAGLFAGDMEPDYQGFSDLVDVLMEQRRKLIILMDDFEIPVQSGNFPTDFFSFLRGIANNSDVAYVTATSERLQVLFRDQKRPESPFYNIFGFVPVGPLEEDDVRSLIESPIKGDRSPLADHAERIYQLAGGFPVLVHHLCRQLFSARSQRGVLEDSDFEAASGKVLKDCDDYLCGYWENLSGEEQHACEVLLKGERLDGFQEVLGSLKAKGFFDVGPDTGEAVVFPGLLRKYAAKRLGL